MLTSWDRDVVRHPLRLAFMSLLAAAHRGD